MFKFLLPDNSGITIHLDNLSTNNDNEKDFSN